LGSEEVTIVGPAAGVGRDTQIVFTKSIPSNSPGCLFEISVVSSGLSGQFYPGAGSSPQSQSTTRAALVLPPLKSGRLITFIVHGLSDNPASFVPLRDVLSVRLATGYPSIEQSRFVFDLGYTLPDCVPIAEGALRLAARVRQYPFRPGDQIVFLAHSMGGLVVRKMLADNLLGVLTSSYPVAGFITLGTPHLGYPYVPVDGWTSVTGKCTIQVEQMQSYLDPPVLMGLLDGVMSPFLSDLYRAWRPSQAGRWLAAGGAACATASRNVPGYNNGCRAINPLSDAVVCQESAVLSYPDNPLLMTPNEVFTDPNRRFQHGENVGLYIGGNVLCGDPPFGLPSQNLSLTNPPVSPPADAALFNQIVRFYYAL